MTNAERIAAFARLRLRELLGMPDAWGRPHAVEMQVLLLVEVLLVTAHKEHIHLVANLNQTYLAFLNTKVGGPKNTYLTERLELTERASAQFQSILGAFVQSQVGGQATPSVSPSHRTIDHSPDALVH